MHYITVFIPVLVGLIIAVYYTFRDRRKPSQATVS